MRTSVAELRPLSDRPTSRSTPVVCRLKAVCDRSPSSAARSPLLACGVLVAIA